MGGDAQSAKFGELPLIGSIFVDRYEIKGVLGEGDRKRTYLAHDNKVDRQVALSLIMPEATAFDPEGTAREAHVLGHIGTHDNVVSLYDYEVDHSSGYEYMVFEYLSGGTLAKYLKDTGPLPLEVLLKFGRQLCRGLSHLHIKGLIHRDISLANIWLDDRLTAHLGDFDSAVEIDEQDKRRPLTTNSYASPEELGGGPLGFQSDLFSLGKIFSALATGNSEFTDASYIRRHRPDLPTSFVDLVKSLLAAEPSDRPPSADAVLKWLNDVGKARQVGGIIATGEGSDVEFKASLLHPRDSLRPKLRKKVRQGLLTEKEAEEMLAAKLSKEDSKDSPARNDIRKSLAFSVTKTVAAFLNSEGGTLLIGVEDDGFVVGVEDDFQDLGSFSHDVDGWLLRVRQILVDALSGDIWSSVRVSVVPHEDHLVAVITCEKRNVATWHVGNVSDRDEHFYVRSTSSTEELKGSSLVAYIRQHWNWY